MTLSEQEVQELLEKLQISAKTESRSGLGKRLDNVLGYPGLWGGWNGDEDSSDGSGEELPDETGGDPNVEETPGFGSGDYPGWGVSIPSVPELGDLTGRVGDHSDYLRQMYAAQKETKLAQLKAAYEQNLARIDQEQSGVSGVYQAARNQSAASNEQARRNFAQYAAANGLNNGTAGQAELARSVTQQNSQNAIYAAEADALVELQLQRTNAETEYNNAIAKAETDGDYELAYALYQEKVRVEEALMEAEIQQQKYALEQYKLRYQQSQAQQVQ